MLNLAISLFVSHVWVASLKFVSLYWFFFFFFFFLMLDGGNLCLLFVNQFVDVAVKGFTFFCNHIKGCILFIWILLYELSICWVVNCDPHIYCFDAFMILSLASLNNTIGVFDKSFFDEIENFRSENQYWIFGLISIKCLMLDNNFIECWNFRYLISFLTCFTQLQCCFAFKKALGLLEVGTLVSKRISKFTDDCYGSFLVFFISTF